MNGVIPTSKTHATTIKIIFVFDILSSFFIQITVEMSGGGTPSRSIDWLEI